MDTGEPEQIWYVRGNGPVRLSVGKPEEGEKVWSEICLGKSLGSVSIGRWEDFGFCLHATRFTGELKAEKWHVLTCFKRIFPTDLLDKDGRGGSRREWVGDLGRNSGGWDEGSGSELYSGGGKTKWDCDYLVYYIGHKVC